MIVKALLVWILPTLHMEFIGSLSRAHPSGIGSVSVHLFRAGNRNETTAGFEPWLSQAWGKWGKNQSETQDRNAVESLEMRERRQIFTLHHCYQKGGEKLLPCSYFWTGKADPDCDHSHRDSLQFKKKNTQNPTWQRFLEGRKTERKEGRQRALAQKNVFLRCLCDFCQWREKCLSSSQMSNSSCPCGNTGSPSSSRQSVHLCFPLDSDKFLFGFILASWSSFTSCWSHDEVEIAFSCCWTGQTALPIL